MPETEQKYVDIINQSRPVSSKHPPMSMLNRAAQFSPFAALTGYDSAVKETARLTDEKIALDEYAKSMLNIAAKLNTLAVSSWTPSSHMAEQCRRRKLNTRDGAVVH